jgi:uncharacterized membrane protein YgcG
MPIRKNNRRWTPGPKKLFLFLAMLLLCSTAFAQDFTIRRFHSDIAVHEDSSFAVQETIEVDFTRPRHGIYRTIPFRFINELGKTIQTPLRVISVTDESGRNLKYRTEKKRNIILIRIGEASRYVEGRQTYRIVYRVENAVLFFDDHDELYWNVTGNEWKAPILSASAGVSLISSRKSLRLLSACYTGVAGSTESQCVSETMDNGGIFTSRRILRPGEGFTIALGWDKGIVTAPSSWKRFLWAVDLKENWVFLLPFGAFFYMFSRWYRLGRDPRVRESIQVMYAPPEYNGRPMIPAEIGTLVDEKMDPRDITSTIVGLAVKGYLVIEEKKKEGWIFDSADYFIRKVRDPDSDLTDFEARLMKHLIPRGKSGIWVSQLKNKFYTHLKQLKETVFEELVKKKYFLKSPESVRNQYLLAGFLIMILGGLLSGWVMPGSAGKGIFAWILCGLTVIGFSRVMPVKTRGGASAYMDIMGFQEFLNRTEKDRIERMGDKNLFSKFLPYAIALGVADNWAKAFEGVYQEPPQWYVSPGGFRTFTPHGFSDSLNSVTSSLASAMFAAPRGSGASGGGSGGGGFSGGGFGGGGGGSW